MQKAVENMAEWKQRDLTIEPTLPFSGNLGA
jgi:hypothetical protein